MHWHHPTATKTSLYLEQGRFDKSVNPAAAVSTSQCSCLIKVCKKITDAIKNIICFHMLYKLNVIIGISARNISCCMFFSGKPLKLTWWNTYRKTLKVVQHSLQFITLCLKLQVLKRVSQRDCDKSMLNVWNTWVGLMLQASDELGSVWRPNLQ